MRNLLLTAIVCSLLLSGCNAKREIKVYGHYYTDGTVMMSDGNDTISWECSADSISIEKLYDGMPVVIILEKNGQNCIKYYKVKEVR